MEDIIRELEYIIDYFKDGHTDFQRGRAYQAQKTLEKIRQTLGDVSDKIK